MKIKALDVMLRARRQARRAKAQKRDRKRGMYNTLQKIDRVCSRKPMHIMIETVASSAITTPLLPTLHRWDQFRPQLVNARCF